MLFATGACVWWLGKHRLSKPLTATAVGRQSPSSSSHSRRSAPLSPIALLSNPGAVISLPASGPFTPHASRISSHLSLRLTNSSTPLGLLVRSPAAILLENALLDTSRPLALPIPDSLRAQGDPGAYVVQSRAPLDDAFRARLQAAGALIVAYIPNQAYLVRASQAVAQQLQTDPRIQAVLPYEPYFKLQPPLLSLAVEQQPLPDNQALNLLLFPDARAAALDQLKNLGVEILGEEPSPFGPVLRVSLASADLSAGTASSASPALILPALARLPGVQHVELSRARVLANDLSRARIGVAANTTTADNYLGLRGSNVLVNVNDSGVDTNHPDLQGRVVCDVPGQRR